jgi:hypothetical protein
MERSLETYLRLKKRTTYFRKRIPDTLRPLLGLNEVNLRLGAINRWEAEVRGLHLASEFTGAAFDQIESI